ncbi:hypothetical protein [Clostridium cylindrosporum]|uniref:Sporulation membrane protein YtrI C-terminal domain-containing protein n=1 Tax=Clostridium cylindrosporum DSM 605 TaxID=1121307 RepID=A0A0J8G6T8_CLOCY|nr:hypothetical protein [Clostridium cylindrosporum]KMT23311.1 hypothetical protein CLCY_8c00470 [Clostridium cylindrosporum DSM 605]
MGRVRKAGFLLFFLSGFILGVLLGCASLSAFISYRLDEYHQRIAILNSIIDEKNMVLEKLEDNINKKKLIVKDIEINLTSKEDELINIELKKYIQKKLGTFVGKEVKKVEADMLWEVINQRIMKIGGKEYRLKANKVVISEIINIWIEIQPLKK